MSRNRSSATRVLIIDDCADTTGTMAWLLSSSGFHVREAHTAQQALDQADEFEPDVVLLDLSLGERMTGFDIARRLRQRDTVKRMRIAAVTGWDTAVQRRLAAEAGCDAYFVKPIKVGAIGDYIQRVQVN
jgi:DNA-binding response OmpR family regulator